MAAAERIEADQRGKELKSVIEGLADLESRFLKHLDLLNKGILTEREFTTANESFRSQKAALEDRQRVLEHWIGEQRDKVSAAARIPGAIKTFVEDMQALDPRLQKAHLQTILKTAHVHRDGDIELEFRSKSP